MKLGISLFSNAGIGDLGVENAGVHIKYANELLEERANTYRLNHPNTNVLCGDINNISEDDYKNMLNNLEEELFLLVATPPCQGVSGAGKRDKFDIRNQLIKPTVKAIKSTLPLWVWIENVPNYRNATIPDTEEIVEDNEDYERINILDYLDKHLTPLGYKIKSKLLDSKNYGVPQTRKRLIIIMTRTDKEVSFPEPSHGKNNLPYKTVKDAIGHLEPLESGEKSKNDDYHYANKHNPNHIKWMKATPEGQTAFDNPNFEDRPHVVDINTGEIRLIKAFRTTYKRMWWNKPAPTVTMYSNSISSQNNVHPRDSRALTVREAMLLQSIPEWFRFPIETKEKQMREMIGEAVPTLLAQVITEHIIYLHDKS